MPIISRSFAEGFTREALGGDSMEHFYFFKEGCPSCEEMDEVIEKFEDEYNINFIKIDIMSSTALTNYFQVDRVPVIVFEKNNRKYRIRGYVNFKKLKDMYEKVKNDE